MNTQKDFSLVILLFLHHYCLLIASHQLGATTFLYSHSHSTKRTSAPSRSITTRASMSMASSSSKGKAKDMTSNNDENPKQSSQNVIHWAIVGLGDVCTIKSGPAFYKSHGSTLSAVMRRTPGAAQAWIKNNAPNLPTDVADSIRAFDSVEEMLEEMGNSSELDAIYVATPPGAHLENVRQIVKAIPPNNGSDGDGRRQRLKAVYVEKPCGRCAWETRAMIDELRARNIEFYPAYVSRAHERTVVLRKLLGEEKVCGDRITGIKYTQRGSSLARGLDDDDDDNTKNNNKSIPWRLNANQSGGGLIMDMGCHILDRLDYLFGPLENVKSTVLRKGGREGGGATYPLVEDYVAMSASIGDCNWSAVDSTGASVECVWDFSPKEADQDGDVDELVISGPEGSLCMAGMGAGLPIEVLGDSGRIVRTLEFDAPKHAAQPLIQTIVDELLELHHDDGAKGNISQCPARGDNAIRTSEVLDVILGSYYGGRHDEFWSRSESWPGLKASSS